MSTTTAHFTNPTVTRAAATDGATTRRSLCTSGLVSGVVAAAATTATAVAARAIDIPLDVQGEQIPLAGFAQLTLFAAAIGVVLAVLARRTAHPRRVFVGTTVALTVVSLVPDVVVDTGTATKLVLALTHVIAAAIVVPVLAKRLPT